MPRINTISNPSEQAQKLLDGVKAKLGKTPNMMSTMAHSAATLDAYLKLSDALSKGELSGQAREQIALAVGQANSCEYCLSAHSAIGKMVGLSSDQIRDARLGRAEDEKSNAILKFANRLVEARGNVSDEEITAARTAGVTEGELTEIVANTALNIFTNYFNHVAAPEVDFPQAEELESGESCSTGACNL